MTEITDKDYPPVSDIDNYRPHIALYGDKDAHVLPVALIEDWIVGKADPEPEIYRLIIREWLATVQARGFCD